MLEEILDIRNVQKAFKQVTANKGESLNYTILKKEYLDDKALTFIKKL